MAFTSQPFLRFATLVLPCCVESLINPRSNYWQSTKNLHKTKNEEVPVQEVQRSVIHVGKKMKTSGSVFNRSAKPSTPFLRTQASVVNTSSHRYPQLWCSRSFLPVWPCSQLLMLNAPGTLSKYSLLRVEMPMVSRVLCEGSKMDLEELTTATILALSLAASVR